MYYDVQKQKWISDEENKKEIAQDKDLKSIHKCLVCENRQWCNKNEKDKTGCETEFVLDELNIYSEAYKSRC